MLSITTRGTERFTGVRLRYSLAGEPQRVGSEAYWRWPAPGGAEWPIMQLHLFDPGDGREKRLWLGEGTTRLTVVVHSPAAVRIEGVTPFVAE
jgi:hypothetical protein